MLILLPSQRPSPSQATNSLLDGIFTSSIFAELSPYRVYSRVCPIEDNAQIETTEVPTSTLCSDSYCSKCCHPPIPCLAQGFAKEAHDAGSIAIILLRSCSLAAKLWAYDVISRHLLLDGLIGFGTYTSTLESYASPVYRGAGPQELSYSIIIDTFLPLPCPAPNCLSPLYFLLSWCSSEP